ncbi:apolipophorin-3-like [Hetaerina americana]|uniref:apolipophorin-3-like n=1 Tax=Hetaerina americana TaxID=62018 RepID=UPI003A7F49FF
MAAAAFVFLVALAVFSQASSSPLERVIRDVDATANVEDFVNTVRTQLQTVGAEVTKAIRGEEGAVTMDDMKAVVEAKTQELQEKARAFTEEASRQLESRRSEMSEATAHALEQAAQQVNASLEHVQELARNSPSAVDSFNESFKKTVETLVEENSKLARAAGDDVGAAHDQLATLSRNTLNQAMELMRNFATQMQTAASKTS